YSKILKVSKESNNKNDYKTYFSLIIISSYEISLSTHLIPNVKILFTIYVSLLSLPSMIFRR
ncbi:hypothetical protein, partial [Methanobrevibacter smithii]|uniref:hypothetical protein n=1 Tax=Methanobrevibacter smithii TaxID=2173 RepID=UPI0037DC2995